MAGRCAQRWHGESGRRPQRGAALMVFLILLVMAGLTYVLNSFSPEALQARRAQRGDTALREAQEALLGYALKFREEQLKDGQNAQAYGYLPLPDLGSSRNNNPGCTQEGCDAADFAGNGANLSVIGRLPWRTLGIPPLRDGNGECLWYAVSGSHQRIHQATPMNWDTPGHFDIVVADGTAALASVLASAHERPVAVVFSPGPALAGQDRGKSQTDVVDECGGNYVASNYLDPGGIVLDGATNYFSGGTNAASGDASATAKKLSAAGIVQRRDDGTLWAGACPSGASCAVAANDRGLALGGDALFGALRKSAHFRDDINTLLDRIATCLRDEIAAGNPPVSSHAKIAGVDSHACYGQDAVPLGYYPHYKEMIFVAAPGGGLAVTLDGAAQSCAGALIFAGQRATGQSRGTAAEKSVTANYLEGANLASFSGSGTSFAGPSLFARVSTGQTASQDILRCIPSGASLTTVESTSLTALGVGQLASYDAASRTLSLGQQGVESSDWGMTPQALFGCAWQPEAHAAGRGLRAYFKFNIQYTGTAGDGFVFALADGDANGAGACGAARQHLGYSGNNGYTTSIAHPKIGIEVDTRRNYRANAAFTDPTGFDPSYISASPSSISYLNNGRADPSYTGGHVAIVYWGGESAISTGRSCGFFGCTAPQFCSDGVCYLNPEEDDNVHGRSANPPATRPPPQNPVAPAAPAAPPAGVYKLDPSLSQVPTNQDIHVRVELAREQPDDGYNSRPVRVATTANVALAGLQTIDGVALAAGDRVLLAGQTNGAENGVYVAAAGPWARAVTENTVIGMPPGSAWIVREGTANAWTYWRFSNPESYSIGGDAITIVKTAPDWKAVATAPVVLSGLQEIAGVQLAAGDQVLVIAQASAADNGIYLAQADAWTRIPMYKGSYTTQAWILKDSATDANRIAYMKMTPRPLAELDAAFTPHLSDGVTIYAPAEGACAAGWQCPSGQWCGLDNVCYRPGFRTLRLGFTNAQGTTDQVITVSDFGTTWLP